MADSLLARRCPPPCEFGNDLVLLLALSAIAEAQQPPATATPTDVKPGSITCEDVAYPFPVSYLPLTLYGQEVRMAFLQLQ
jgi:hypothetical protein